MKKRGMERKKRRRRRRSETPRAGDADEWKATTWGGGRGKAANSYIKADAREERQQRQMKGTLWARRSG